MTGTSVDGIDAALIEVEGAGLAMHAGFLKGASAPLGSLGSRLREFASNSPQCAEEVAQMAMTLGKIHAEVLRELLGDAEPDLIVLHGQTVFHRPPLSWQLINPWPVAAQFKAEIIIDLRGADLAAGGQGAPITPLADFILFRNDTRARVILNFGGFINYTFIPDGSNFLRSSSQSNEAWLNEVQGGDISPCNQLLDSIVRKSFGMPYDDGGAIAMQGMVDERAQQSLLRRLKHAESATRSLGTGDEAFEWHDEFKGLLEPADILRTACAAIADRVAGVIAKYGDVDVLAALTKPLRQSMGFNFFQVYFRNHMIPLNLSKHSSQKPSSLTAWLSHITFAHFTHPPL